MVGGGRVQYPTDREKLGRFVARNEGQARCRNVVALQGVQSLRLARGRLLKEKTISHT